MRKNICFLISLTILLLLNNEIDIKIYYNFNYGKRNKGRQMY